MTEADRAGTIQPSARIERRAAWPVSASADQPRRLVGTAMKYLEVAQIAGLGAESFMPGALTASDGLMLNLEHDELRALTERGGLAVLDTGGELTMQAQIADTPLGDRALADVRAGRMTGLSIEFRAERERMEAGIRIIERATLTGLALTSSPAYQQTSVEARKSAPVARRRIWL